jgi:hypothetical protein
MQLFIKVVFIGLLMVADVLAVKNPWDVRLAFKSATIIYDVSGMQSGTEILYIDEYGKKKAMFRKTSGTVMFQSIETNTVEITTDEWLYKIDLNKKSGTKTVNPAKYFKEEYDKLTHKEQQTVNENAEKMGTSLIGGMQGSIEKNAATILGYKVDKTTMMGSTVYIIHGSSIVLKSESQIMGMSSKSVAVELKKKAVPKNVFDLPKGVEITFDKDADAMMRTMVKSMIDKLKDPQAAEKMQEQSLQYRQAAEEEAHRRETQAHENASESDEQSDQDDINDVVEKGLKALEGLF